MNNRIYISLLATIICISVCIGCNKNEPESITADEIVFSPGAEVRATELTTLNLENIGVFATIEENGNEFNSNNAVLKNFMDNIKVAQSSEGWSATPKHYWPSNSETKLSFFAYAPYNEFNQEILVPGTNDWSNGKTLEINFSPKQNPYNQVDLCVAKAVLDQSPPAYGQGAAPLIELNFKHTLSWISFEANYTGDIPDGCYLRIDEISLRNIIDENTLVYNSQEEIFFSWKSLENTENKGNYTLSIYGGTLGDTPLCHMSENKFTDIATATGYLFLLPQVINPPNNGTPSMIDVTFSYVKNDNKNTVIAQFYISKKMPHSEWFVNKRIKYQMTLDITSASLINITPAIVDWIESGNIHPDTEIQ